MSRNAKDSGSSRLRAIRGLMREATNPQTVAILEVCQWGYWSNLSLKPDDLAEIAANHDSGRALQQKLGLSDSDVASVADTAESSTGAYGLRTLLVGVLAARLMPFALGLKCALNYRDPPSEQISRFSHASESEEESDDADQDDSETEQTGDFDPEAVEASQKYWSDMACSPLGYEAQIAAITVAQDMFLGGCQCQDEETRSRMGRRSAQQLSTHGDKWQQHCLEFHCIDGWDPAERSLDNFLAVAVTRFWKYENRAKAAWSCANIMSQFIREGRYIDEISSGILLMKLASRTGTLYEVIPVARCANCRERLTRENSCQCHRRNPTLWPTVIRSEKHIYLQGQSAELGEMHRCPACIAAHTRKCEESGGCKCPRRLFFGTQCPVCGGALNSKDTTHVWLPLRTGSDIEMSDHCKPLEDEETAQVSAIREGFERAEGHSNAQHRACVNNVGEDAEDVEELKKLRDAWNRPELRASNGPPQTEQRLSDAAAPFSIESLSSVSAGMIESAAKRLDSLDSPGLGDSRLKLSKLTGKWLNAELCEHRAIKECVSAQDRLDRNSLKCCNLSSRVNRLSARIDARHDGTKGSSHIRAMNYERDALRLEHEALQRSIDKLRASLQDKQLTVAAATRDCDEARRTLCTFLQQHHHKMHQHVLLEFLYSGEGVSASG